MNNNPLHIMDNTNKIITIIGLVFEFVSVFLLIIVSVLISSFENWFEYREDLMSVQEYDDVVNLLGVLVYVFIPITIILGIIAIINLSLFRKLIRGKFTESQAHKVYLYQAVYGGINLLSNQIVGILYLISGIYGFKGYREETNIRPGI